MAASARTSEAETCYVIALGSNQRHHRHGPPAKVLRAALPALEWGDVKLLTSSPIVASAPLGPSRRHYANAAAIVRTAQDPPSLLAGLKAIERQFGRPAGGQRWRARVLDLDIVLWQGGGWASPGLTVPHIAFRHRRFVLGPAAAIAPRWRDPITRLTLRQIYARLTRPRPLPR